MVGENFSVHRQFSNFPRRIAKHAPEKCVPVSELREPDAKSPFRTITWHPIIEVPVRTVPFVGSRREPAVRTLRGARRSAERDESVWTRGRDAPRGARYSQPDAANAFRISPRRAWRSSPSGDSPALRTAPFIDDMSNGSPSPVCKPINLPSLLRFFPPTGMLASAGFPSSLHSPIHAVCFRPKPDFFNTYIVLNRYHPQRRARDDRLLTDK